MGSPDSENWRIDDETAHNPTGPASGSRHVYRGGGWNDFAKNMRSAYRAAGQEDMHKQARPELLDHVRNMDEYDIILLGYPNWWASIPMPIASFLEEYDISGKTLIPFCSHGGGRFGQSLTAIAKLAPDAVMHEGLSVHYSGGSTLSEDVAAWLEMIGIERN